MFNNENDEIETNNIIKNVADFVNEKRDLIEDTYSNAKGQKRKLYIKAITMKEYLDNLAKVSVVILTANKFEENILNYYVYNDQTNPIQQPILEVDHKVIFKNDHIKFNAYLLTINSYSVLHLHAKNTGSYTTGGSADLVRYVAENELIHPTCIISYGICFGHDYKSQKIGDIIIAKKLYPYFIGVKSSDGTLYVKSDEFTIHMDESSSQLYERIEQLERNGLLDAEDKEIEGRVEVGNLITGEAVISDVKYKKAFEQAANSISPKGGEMEGYGLGKECLFYNIPCALIKSISDWGVAKNIDQYIEKETNLSQGKDKIQAYTAYCAYTVLKRLFREKIFEVSLYDRFKSFFINQYQSGIGCYVPFKDIMDEFLEYNHNQKHCEAFKIVTKKYINKFCDLMVKDGIWTYKNNGEKGFMFIK